MSYQFLPVNCLVVFINQLQDIYSVPKMINMNAIMDVVDDKRLLQSTIQIIQVHRNSGLYIWDVNDDDIAKAIQIIRKTLSS
jgi:hypothetical protein